MWALLLLRSSDEAWGFSMPARSVALGLREPWWEGVMLAKPLGPQGLPCPAPQRQPGHAASPGTGWRWASSAWALPTWSCHTCPSCALGTKSPCTPGLGERKWELLLELRN